jgi:hypothetical protein
VGREL